MLLLADADDAFRRRSCSAAAARASASARSWSQCCSAALTTQVSAMTVPPATQIDKRSLRRVGASQPTKLAFPCAVNACH